MTSPKLLSDDQNYVLRFLTKEALLGQDIDFPQSLTGGLLRDVVFQQINRRLDLLIRDNLSANFVENEYLWPKVLF